MGSRTVTGGQTPHNMETTSDSINTIHQINYRLTLMLTISGISFLILIVSVLTLLGFIWYTKNLLTRKGGCPNLQNANVNILNQQSDSIQPFHLQPVADQPVQMYMLNERK